MVLQVCIACGKKFPLRMRFCSCGHVMAENVILNANSRLRRNGEKRMRQITIKLKRGKQPNLEARVFYLGQAERLKLAEKGNNNKTRLQHVTNSQSTSEQEKRRQKLLLLEETKQRMENLFSSPQFQLRMEEALMKINKKIGRQQTFLKLISRRETRLSKCR